MKTITAIARQYNVGPDAVRHYTKLGMLTPVRCDTNGYRYFDRAEESKLSFILSAKKLGFSLKDIRKILHTAGEGDSPCPLVRELIDKRLREVRKELLDTQRLASRLESACDKWRKLPDRMPSGEFICHLIEACQDHALASDQDTSWEYKRNGTR